MKRWYVVNTRPHQESRADLNLRRQGFQSWLPRLRRTRRHGRRLETVLRPLFPGYLFVCFDPETEPWRLIFGTFGVRSLICHDDRPTPVAGGLVEALHQSTDDDGVVRVAPEDLKPGDRLRVISGAFADQVGTLIRLADRDRVALLLEMLGREVHTTVGRDQVVAAG
jgi:transcriptional antiterminator RfaH